MWEDLLLQSVLPLSREGVTTYLLKVNVRKLIKLSPDHLKEGMKEGGFPTWRCQKRRREIQKGQTALIKGNNTPKGKGRANLDRYRPLLIIIKYFSNSTWAQVVGHWIDVLEISGEIQFHSPSISSGLFPLKELVYSMWSHWDSEVMLIVQILDLFNFTLKN